MESTKVLLVGSGYKECGVLSFEKYNKTNSLTLNDWVKKLKETPNKQIIVDDEDYYFTVELFEFGFVDTKFVDFVNNEIKDYDFSKHIDFFVVKE